MLSQGDLFTHELRMNSVNIGCGDESGVDLSHMQHTAGDKPRSDVFRHTGDTLMEICFRSEVAPGWSVQEEDVMR